MTYTQAGQYCSITTPLGAEKLLLRGFHGEEAISQPFHFTLEMVSQQKDLSFDGIVGKPATITVNLKDGKQRYINGIVSRFYQAGTTESFTAYYAELVPALWKLSLVSDSQIFFDKTVPEIVDAVLQANGITDFRISLSGQYVARDYCVQYQETALAFISRLLEDEGIAYYFEHKDGTHVLVLVDAASSYKACPALSGSVRYQSSLAGETSEDAISTCTVEQQLIVGTYAVNDFNFETPSNALTQQASGTDTSLTLYEYPAGFGTASDGQQRAKVRLESEEWGKTLLRGEAFSPAFTSGYSITLVGHDRDDANTTWVLHRLTHQATGDRYVNSFEAFLSTAVFHPARRTPKPRIAGAQTAIVVGKSGEEIWTDTYGRVKVQFHWDRKGQKDEKSSCWIRVAQGWAGKGWGSVFIPRIGQEVIVSFLEGDPDRPLITGSVYNAESTVPYALPDESTKSAIKSNSSKGGGGGNEIRFEDKKDSEELLVHAQKDLKVEVLNDETSTITKNRVASIEEGNETLTVKKGNRTVQVSQGNETHEVQGKRDVTVTGAETHSNKANYKQTVAGNLELSVTGNLTIDVTGSITIKSAQSLTLNAMQNLTAEAQMNLTNKAGMALSNEANMTVSSKANASHEIKSGGIMSIEGALVKIG